MDLAFEILKSGFYVRGEATAPTRAAPSLPNPVNAAQLTRARGLVGGLRSLVRCVSESMLGTVEKSRLCVCAVCI